MPQYQNSRLDKLTLRENAGILNSLSFSILRISTHYISHSLFHGARPLQGSEDFPRERGSRWAFVRARWLRLAVVAH